MDVVLRALVVYIVVFGFTRIIGRRELSSLQPFDLILLVVIGDLVQSGVTQNDQSVTGIVLVISTIGLMQVLTSYIGFRFRRVRKVLEGEPVCWSTPEKSSNATCNANASTPTTSPKRHA